MKAYPGRAHWIRVLGRVGGVLAAVIAVLATRAVTSSRGELIQGRAAEEAGEVDLAVVHYRRAAAWYTPGNPYSATALTRLVAVAESAAQEDDLDRRLLAWRSVRAAILSSRSFYTPHVALLEEANRQIADAMASRDPPPIDLGKSREQVRQEHLELLEATTRPSVFWTLVLLVGFVGWSAGGLFFARFAVDEEDRIVPRPARIWGMVILVGLGLFFAGLALA